MPRDAIVKHLGFTTLNGASATLLSALAKYGLLEAAGSGEARVSDSAMRILYPHNPEEKQAALLEAAFKPSLFAELQEKWPERPPSDESLRSYLVRRGFSQTALEQVIQIYRETIDIAGPKSQVQDGGRSAAEAKEAQMGHAHSTGGGRDSPPPAQPVPNGKPFTVAFDGTVLTGSLAIRSVRDIDRLMKVLQAQKAAFEAMQDDWDDDAPSADDQRDAAIDREADENNQDLFG
jgi:single-stranded DNA-binding protein